MAFYLNVVVLRVQKGPDLEDPGRFWALNVAFMLILFALFAFHQGQIRCSFARLSSYLEGPKKKERKKKKKAICFRQKSTRFIVNGSLGERLLDNRVP